MASRVILKRARARNFKSFSDLDLDLGGLNVVIGANASGKSNLAALFGFLRDAHRRGLDNAVSLQGGAGCVRAFGRGAGSTSIELYLELDARLGLAAPRTPGLRVTGARWCLELRPAGAGLSVVQDRWVFDVARSGDARPGTVTAEMKNGRVHLEADHPRREQILKALGGYEERTADLFIRSHLAAEFFPAVTGFFRGIGVYDFEPGLAKGPVSAQVAELEGDGSNLALALRRILSDSRRRRMLNNLVSVLVPSARSVGAGQAGFWIDMGRPGSLRMPSHMLSDGTVGAVALVAALYFERRSLVVIEGPERSMHPSLMPRIMDMAREASVQKQVIMTTHSPELVRCADPGSLLLAARDGDGASHVSRPSRQGDVRAFLGHGVGIEELYVQDLLGP